MNYMNLLSASCVDFKNWSTVLQVSHCTHMCVGCFNKSSWKKNAGNLFTEETYRELLACASKSFIKNVVIQGGDPLSPLNYQEVITLCRRLRKDLPEINIVLFTGYTYSELQVDLLRQPILNTIDVLVDGKFEQSLSKNPPPFRGSSNQRVLYLDEEGNITKEI